MYLCICNAITDRDVLKAVQNGATQWDEVHAYLGHTPNCGQCACDFESAIACAGKAGPEPALPLEDGLTLEAAG